MLHLLRKHALWTYFVLAFILTWGGSAVVAGQSTTSSAGGISSLSQVPAALLVLLGPAIAALAASSIEAGWHGVSQVLRSLLIWRVGWKIWIFIIFYPLLHHLLASILRWAIWETPVHFFYTPALSQNSIVLALATAIAVNLIRGLGEEIGWRGYALPRLQCRWNAWWSSVILGIIWAIWHWHPANMQILGISLIWHFLSIIPATFVYTWLYNNSRGSLLTAVIFHMWLNVSEYIVPLDVYDGVGSGLVVLAIVNWIAAGIVSINLSHQSKSLNT